MFYFDYEFIVLQRCYVNFLLYYMYVNYVFIQV